MGTRILKIDLEMAEIIDPKVGNPLQKESNSAIKMIISKSSLSYLGHPVSKVMVYCVLELYILENQH